MGAGLRGRGGILLGRAAGAAVRRAGRGGGTALPGLLAGHVAPELTRDLAAQLGRGVVTVTGTNGKTTTTHLLAAIARAGGWRPLANRSGSNLERGIASALIDAATASGVVREGRERLGVFEVDEAAWPALLPRLRPRVAVFLNLFRDQLDRYGEVDSVADGWREALQSDASGVTLVLNADDPAVSQLAEAARGDVVWFGVEDERVALDRAEHAADARFCRCGAAFRYDAIYMGHVGRWRCGECGRRRAAPQVRACDVRLGAEEARFELWVGELRLQVTSPLAGLYSVYNALAAAAAASAAGLPVESIARALAEAGPAFGRQERFTLGDRVVRLLLAKNPAGLNEVLRVLAASKGPVTVLAMLNDGIQDGRDVSWVYDADIERLAGRVACLVISGTRAEDFALRWVLAGVEPGHVERETERALASTPAGGRLDVVATYTAMLGVRAALARRAGAAAYWEGES